MADPPGGVPLTRNAERDLERLLHRNRQEFNRLWDDLIRWSRGQPPQSAKKLRGFAHLYQFDSGRYRVVYADPGGPHETLIVRILSKPEQARTLRHLR